MSLLNWGPFSRRTPPFPLSESMAELKAWIIELVETTKKGAPGPKGDTGPAGPKGDRGDGLPNNMVSGVEYATGRKWNGKDVFVKMVDFGALPNKNMSYAIGNFPEHAHAVNISGVAVQQVQSGDDSYICREYPFPLMIHGGATAVVFYDAWSCGVTVQTDYDLSGFNATFVVEYVKDFYN